jgi:hypothetical protein
VLLLSSEEDPRVATRALEEGASAFLSKNLAPGLLLRKLQQFLTAAILEAAVLRILHRCRNHLLLPPHESN